ncbi:MAG: DnaJ domain-containing protein [Moraxella sp.]|nr:DnaJ domain-containing protein [Moraxella sp.]
MKFATHYDNLGVAKNAQPEVIKAAYKALAQKYHPDRNPNNPDAQRIMTIINTAYQVLSDPASRAEHDRWIAQQQARQSQTGAQETHQKPKPEQVYQEFYNTKTNDTKHTQQNTPNTSVATSKKLHCSDSQRLVAGVLGGIAEYANCPPIVVRAVFVLAVIVVAKASWFLALLIYGLLWFVMPKNAD